MYRLLLLLLFLATARVVSQRARAPASLSFVPLRHDVQQLIHRVRRSSVDLSTQLAIIEPNQMQKERRMLRKKKRRLKELRQEIRMLTHQLHGGAVPTTAVTGSPRWMDQQEKWRRKMYEKMKSIMRRLDRLESVWAAEDFGLQQIETRGRAQKKQSKQKPSRVKSTTLATPVTLLAATTTNDLKAEKSSIDALRTGENGTACAAHADCKPGRCCVREKASEGGFTSVCTFNGLPEAAPCRDSCQCSDRLHCFQPHNNQTQAVCKKAAVNDVHSGYYLNRKDSHFTIASSKKKKR